MTFFFLLFLNCSVELCHLDKGFQVGDIIEGDEISQDYDRTLMLSLSKTSAEEAVCSVHRKQSSKILFFKFVYSSFPFLLSFPLLPQWFNWLRNVISDILVSSTILWKRLQACFKCLIDDCFWRRIWQGMNNARFRPWRICFNFLVNLLAFIGFIKLCMT